MDAINPLKLRTITTYLEREMKARLASLPRILPPIPITKGDAKFLVVVLETMQEMEESQMDPDELEAYLKERGRDAKRERKRLHDPQPTRKQVTAVLDLFEELGYEVDRSNPNRSPKILASGKWMGEPPDWAKVDTGEGAEPKE